MTQPTQSSEIPFRKKSKSHRWLALIPLTIGLTATGCAVLAVRTTLIHSAKREFEFGCSDIQAKIADRLLAHEQILRSGAAFFSDTDGVTREEFRIFAKRQKVDQKLPGIQGLGYAMLIPREQLAGHLSRMHGESFPDYQVWPTGERDPYTSIVFLEPFAGRNLLAFGYDMFSEPIRREAMERARDQDECALSGKVLLVQETEKAPQAGTLMYAPVYWLGARIDSVKERREQLVGWVYSPYRMDDLMSGILGGGSSSHEQHIQVHIFDGETISPATLLYDSSPGSSDLPQASRFTSATSVLSAGRKWSLVFNQPNSPQSAIDYRGAWLTLASGVIISGLLTGWMHARNKTLGRAWLIAKQLTADLKQSEERWQFALEGTGSGVWDWDIHRNGVIFSKQWKAMLGYAEHEIGPTLDEWEQRVNPADKPQVMAILQAHLEDPSVPFVTEYSIARKDGSWLWILDRGLVVQRDATGEPLRMIGTIEDISVRKRTEATLAKLSLIQQALAHLATAFVNLPVNQPGTVIVESLATMGGLIGASRAYLEPYVTARGPMFPRFQWSDPTAPPVPAVPAAALAELFEVHRLGHFLNLPAVEEHEEASAWQTWLRSQGVSSCVALPLMEGPNCIGFVAFESLGEARIWDQEVVALLRVLAELYGNFQARHNAEVQASELRDNLIQARDAAQAAAVAKSMFLANMSHEIRTPLNAVLGYAQIMQHECAGCQNGKRLNAITRSGEHLHELLTDLLELVRGDVHQLPLALNDFDFHQVLGDILIMFRPQAHAQDLLVELAHGPEIPRFIHTDPGKVRQILVNLVGNALKFTTKGKIGIAVTLRPTTTRDELVLQVAVTDSGCGIDPSELEVIFNAFEQAHQGRKSGKGVGLGLPLSRRYAQALGGDVTVTSQLDEGTCFLFTFRAMPAQSCELPQDPRVAMQHLAAGQPAVRVLVVDDDPENRTMLSIMLVNSGFEVEEAASGAEAIDRLRDHRGIDAVLMDKRMPGMDGYETIGHLRKLPGGGDLPVVVVTASGVAEEMSLAYAAGANGYLPKPVRVKELLAELARVCNLTYEPARPIAPPSTVTQAAVWDPAVLSAELHAEFIAALNRGNIQRLHELIAGISSHHATFAAQLGVLVDAYDYERLRALLESTQAGPQEEKPDPAG